jgi:hypothetical protein
VFRRKKKQTANSVFDRVDAGELTVEQGQQLLDLKKIEHQVNDTEQSTRDHGNLVDLRDTWGKVILGILIVTILADFLLVSLVGSNTWSFEGNIYFLNVVITEHLVEIFGLVIIVLKSLFPADKK